MSLSFIFFPFQIQVVDYPAVDDLTKRMDKVESALDLMMAAIQRIEKNTAQNSKHQRGQKRKVDVPPAVRVSDHVVVTCSFRLNKIRDIIGSNMFQFFAWLFVSNVRDWNVWSINAYY